MKRNEINGRHYGISFVDIVGCFHYGCVFVFLYDVAAGSQYVRYFIYLFYLFFAIRVLSFDSCIVRQVWYTKSKPKIFVIFDFRPLFSTFIGHLRLHQIQYKKIPFNYIFAMLAVLYKVSKCAFLVIATLY